jgi:hypothetical protein
VRDVADDRERRERPIFEWWNWRRLFGLIVLLSPCGGRVAVRKAKGIPRKRWTERHARRRQ